MNILIPQLSSVRLSGFDPIFSSAVEFDINNNLYIILGGNGLGKTTILQSIIFGIAGPSDDNIEPQFRDRRWGRAYFKERLDNPNSASIEISFVIGVNSVTLKRGISSDKILEFKLNGEIVKGDKSSGDTVFETFLKESCGYNSIEDFAFVVHKLCYLSEKRENLAWDLESQTRILMQILSDRNLENQFRFRRSTIKELDSAIRHKTVDINALDRRIRSIAENTQPSNSNELSEPQTQIEQFDQSQLDSLQRDIIDLNSKIIHRRREYNDLRFKHSEVVSDVERLRDLLSKFEHSFFFEQLNKFESNEAKLAIYKLIHYKLCPSCGSKSDELYNKAIENLKNECCPLCGTDNILESTGISPGTEAELGEKLKEKVDLEKSLIRIEKELEGDDETLSALNQKINHHILSRQSTVVYIDRKNDKDADENQNIEKLKSAYHNLNIERNSLQIQFDKLQKELDDEYATFNTTNNSRIELLFEHYEKYASEFLGISCTLMPIENADKFLNLKLFVPFFHNKIRRTSDSCSEAQRFFLDIAFRMALIDLISNLSKYNGTFICETPESALDITYINNVSDMFKMFAWTNKNTLLLTSNIQTGGIAQNILSKVKSKKDKLNSFLNLLEIGNLSEVQSSAEGQRLLQSQINKMLK